MCMAYGLASLGPGGTVVVTLTCSLPCTRAKTSEVLPGTNFVLTLGNL